MIRRQPACPRFLNTTLSVRYTHTNGAASFPFVQTTTRVTMCSQICFPKAPAFPPVFSLTEPLNSTLYLISLCGLPVLHTNTEPLAVQRNEVVFLFGVFFFFEKHPFLSLTDVLENSVNSSLPPLRKVQWLVSTCLPGSN